MKQITLNIGFLKFTKQNSIDFDQYYFLKNLKIKGFKLYFKKIKVEKQPYNTILNFAVFEISNKGYKKIKKLLNEYDGFFIPSI